MLRLFHTNVKRVNYCSFPGFLFRNGQNKKVPSFPIPGKIEHQFNLFVDVDEYVPSQHRDTMLLQYVTENIAENKKILIFINGMRQNIAQPTSFLLNRGIDCASLSNRDSRGRRLATLADFRNGRVKN